MFKSWKVLKTILALNTNSKKRNPGLTINNVTMTMTMTMTMKTILLNIKTVCSVYIIEL